MNLKATLILIAVMFTWTNHARAFSIRFDWWFLQLEELSEGCKNSASIFVSLIMQCWEPMAVVIAFPSGSTRSVRCNTTSVSVLLICRLDLCPLKIHWRYAFEIFLVDDHLQVLIRHGLQRNHRVQILPDSTRNKTHIIQKPIYRQSFRALHCDCN